MSRVRSWISTHRWPALLAGAAALLAAGAIAMAIGSGDSADAGSDPAQVFRDCLAEQGVELPEAPPGGEAPEPPDGFDGTPPPSGIPQAGAPAGAGDQEAFGACQELMPEPPEGEGFPPGAPQSAPLPNN
jgi:hypothetical protein